MRPKGIVRLYKRSRLLWERDNLFVNAGLPALANLIAGVTAGQFVAAAGFGSGSTAPAPTDTGFGAAPAYYNAIGSHSFPSPGSVQFNYSLQVIDYAANGIRIQELGLFADSSGVVLPAAVGTANPPWSPSTPVTADSLAVDSNGNIQRCTTAGTTGSSAPVWNTSLGGVSSDGTAVWTLVALHSTPGPMITHAVVPAFAYDGTGNYAGTWTLTF